MSAREDRVHRVGEELAKDDHELVKRYQRTSNARWGGLCEVNGNGCRGATDGKPQDEAENIQNCDIWGKGAPQRSENEDARQKEDIVAASVAI